MEERVVIGMPVLTDDSDFRCVRCIQVEAQEAPVERRDTEFEYMAEWLVRLPVVGDTRSRIAVGRPTRKLLGCLFAQQTPVENNC